MNDLRADLRVLGRSPVPAPRASFVDELEQRLAAIATDGETASVREDELDIVPAASIPRGRGGLAAAVALAVVLSTAGVAVVSSGRDGGGSATVQTAAASSDTASAEEVDVAAAGKTPASTRSATRSSGGGQVPGTSLTSPTQLPPDAVTATTGGLLVGGPHESVAAQPDPTPQELKLSGSGTPAYSFLEWEKYSGEDFAAYLVLRAASPDNPTWPDESKRTIMLMRIEDRDTTKYQAQGKVGTTPRFRIVAIDRDGRVVATTGVFQADVGAGLEAPREIDAPPPAPTPKP